MFKKKRNNKPDKSNVMNKLVPTDFSKVANVAVQYAAMLARKLDAKIILMHVVPPQLDVVVEPGWLQPGN